MALLASAIVAFTIWVIYSELQQAKRVVRSLRVEDVTVNLTDGTVGMTFANPVAQRYWNEYDLVSAVCEAKFSNLNHSNGGSVPESNAPTSVFSITTSRIDDFLEQSTFWMRFDVTASSDFPIVSARHGTLEELSCHLDIRLGMLLAFSRILM